MASPMSAQSSQNKVPLERPAVEEPPEKPHYDQSKQKELSRTSKPDNRPDEDTEEDKIAELTQFCKEVVIILQTVNKNEYQAVLTFMRPPSDSFTKAVIFPEPSMVVGKFANKKVALIRTKPGPGVRKFIEDAIKEYPNARYVLGVGVCYAFDKKFDLADVLVSETIIDNMIVKYNDLGDIEDRGQTVNVVHDLTKIFCMDEDTDCPVSEAGRSSTMTSGTFCSNNVLMNDKIMRDKYLRAHPGAIGGEMEGGELLKFVLESKLEGVIIIKGVADYADGTKAKDWQFTAAMAAASYTESRLVNVPAHKLCRVSAQSPQNEVPPAKHRVDEDSSAVEEPCYQDYVSSLSPDARHFLDVVLDSMNKGVDSDLYKIAQPMLDWEVKLAPLMGLTAAKIHDIKWGQYRDKPVLQRREVLKIWMDKMMLGATYGNLLKVFVAAGHAVCAKELFDLLEEKGSRTR